MRRLIGVGLCLGASMVASCGGKSPTSADHVMPSVVGVTITPSDGFLLVGESVQFSASVTLDNGTSASRLGTWGSDTPTVATVDATGKVTALTRGTVTIFVDVEGHRGTRLVTVAPNFSGEWDGNYTLDTCTDSGDFKAVGFCDVSLAGTVDSIALHVTQDRLVVNGTVTFPTCPCSVDVTGAVRDDGVLVVTGSAQVEGVVLTLENWAARSDQPGALTGSFSLTFTAPGVVGSGRFEARLIGVARTSGPSSLQSRPAASGAISPFKVIQRVIARRGR